MMLRSLLGLPISPNPVSYPNPGNPGFIGTGILKKFEISSRQFNLENLCALYGPS